MITPPNSVAVHDVQYLCGQLAAQHFLAAHELRSRLPHKCRQRHVQVSFHVRQLLLLILTGNLCTQTAWSCECTWSGNLHQDATVRRSKDPPVWACPHTFQVCLQVQSRAHLQAGPSERQSHRPGWPHGRAAPALQPRQSASPLSARLLSGAAPVRPPTQLPAPAPIPQPSDALQGMLSTCRLLRTTASLHLGSFMTSMRPHRSFVSVLWRCACAPSHALASSCSGPSLLWRAAAQAEHSLCCPHIYSLDSEEGPQTRPFELYHALRCADDGS